MQTIVLGHSFVVTAVFWEVKQKLFVSVRLKPAVHMSMRRCVDLKKVLNINESGFFLFCAVSPTDVE